MASPDVSVNMSAKARNVLVAKVLLITLLGLVSGYFYHVSTVADYHRGQTITQADYASTFETYRAGLLQHLWPLAGDLILYVLLFLVVFAIYEGLAYFTAWLVGRVLGAGAQKA